MSGRKNGSRWQSFQDSSRQQSTGYTSSEASAANISAAWNLKNPGNHLAQFRRELSEWFANWFYSRDYDLLYVGSPVLLLSVAALLAAAWGISYSDRPSVIRNYRAALAAAASTENRSGQEICLRALTHLDPANADFAIQLADLLITSDRVAEAIETVSRLAPSDGPGSVEARLWLIRKSKSGDPQFHLSAEERVNQLLTVLNENRGNIEATEILSQIYIETKEWRLAERTLQAAAEVHPEVNLTLLKLQRLLNRPRVVQEKTADRAITALRDKFRENTGDNNLCGQLAEALFLADKVDEARAELNAQIQRNQSPELKVSLSRMELLVANRLLRQTPANRDACCVLAVRALTMDPSSVPAIDLLQRLDRMGALIRPDSLTLVLSHWQQQASTAKDPYQATRIAAGLLKLMNRERDAAELMRPLLAAHPGDRLFVAELLYSSAQTEDADALVEKVASELRDQLKSDPQNSVKRLALARALLLQKKPADAREVLENAAVTAKSQIPEDTEAATVYGSACIAEFDQNTQLTGRIVTLDSDAMPQIPDRATARKLIALLKNAVMSGPVSDNDAAALQAIDRLARITLSRSHGSRDAEQLLTSLRAEGIHTLEILNTLSARALAMDEYDQAVKWLEIANGIAEEKNPAILNNLAIAEVRSTPARPIEALKHVNQSLSILPDHPDILSTRGEVYIALNDWNSAMEDLRKSLAMRPDRPTVHRLMAQTCTASGQIQEARVHQLQAERLERGTAVE